MRAELGNGADRVATALLERIGTKLWGFKPNLMKHFVARHGAVKALRWFAANMVKYEKTLKRWGPVRTHLLAATISTLNGCEYCMYGHAKAFQLHYFKEHGQVFPINENEIFALNELSSDEVVGQMIAVLDEVGLDKDASSVRRMFEIYDGTSRAVSGDDKRLKHLVEMFADLNICGIESDAEVDQIHDPINTDIDLRERYAEMRSQRS